MARPPPHTTSDPQLPGRDPCRVRVRHEKGHSGLRGIIPGGEAEAQPTAAGAPTQHTHTAAGGLAGGKTRRLILHPIKMCPFLLPRIFIAVEGIAGLFF